MISLESPCRPCPTCNGTKTRRSHSKGLEVALRFCGVAYYRCDSCKNRFMGTGSWGKRQWSLVYGILMVVGLLALVWWGLDILNARQPQ